MADTDARDAALWRDHAPKWAESLNRRATVEQWMFDAASGKRPMPTPEQLREWAMKLGVGGDVKAAVGITDVPEDLRAVLEKHFGQGAHLAGNRAASLDACLMRAAGVPIPPGDCTAPDCDCDCEPGFCIQRVPATFYPAARKCDCSGIGDGVSPTCSVHARGVRGGYVSPALNAIDAALLRSTESDLRHLVEANPPGYRERLLETSLRKVQALMQAHGVARNVGGQLVPAGVLGTFNTEEKKHG